MKKTKLTAIVLSAVMGVSLVGCGGGTTTISELIDDGDRVIFYKQYYHHTADESENGYDSEAYPAKDEYCRSMYVLENGNLTYYDCHIKYQELAKMDDDEIIEMLKEENVDSKSGKVICELYTDDTGNKAYYERLELDEDPSGISIDFYDYTTKKVTVYDSEYIGLPCNDEEHDEAYLWYREDMELVLDDVDCEDVTVDPQ